MKIIVGKRRTGKTTRLIEESNLTGGYIVCLNQNEAARLADMAIKMNLKIPFPITFNEFLRGEYYAKGINGFLIDNVDHLLQQHTRVPIKAITLTDE